ncbi:lipoprotein-releasing ABC transporter permease subunit [Candidatus Rariloculus sp.]|uniref:lipoprotein-releasing ABC transporter permease subunit n=1 Tax=Candidatus Rariloculus sp. TaxID=3101265 RepID=UPI003D0CA04E
MKQPYQLSIALRYLRARSRNGFISFISLVSMVGIGLAVAVLIVVLSVMNGFEYELQQRILGMVSDAAITGFDGPLDDWRAVRDRALEREDVVAAAPFVEGQGMVVAGEATAGVAVRGVEPLLEPSVSAIADVLREGSIDALQAGSFNMLIGSILAEELDVGIGDSVVLLLAQGRVTPAGIFPRLRSFTVAGVFEAGMYEYDRGLTFVNMSDAERLFGTDGRASGIRLAVTDIYSAGRVATELAIDLGGGFYVTDWTRQHVNFFRSIQLTKTIMFVILSLVVGVAAFNIVSTLVMVVRDKRGDIAILRSIGTSPLGILAIFANQGTLVGLLGTLFGVGLGLLVVTQLEAAVAVLEAWLNIDLLSAEVYFISDLPTRVNLGEIAQIALLALVLAVAATFYPAFSAARQPPAEALRYE